MSSKRNIARKGMFKTSLFIGGFIILGIILGVLMRDQLPFYEVQSYAGQKGAPERPPKGTYNYVTGTVYSSVGGTIAGARVEAFVKTVSRNVHTDDQGKYTLTYPYCENCKSVIRYSANGYQDQSIDTYQVAGGTLVQDVVLQKLQ